VSVVVLPKKFKHLAIQSLPRHQNQVSIFAYLLLLSVKSFEASKPLPPYFNVVL
jgi:hypothetical protein